MQSSMNERKELDPSIGASVGCSSGITPKRGSNMDNDMSRQYSKELRSEI